MKLLLDTHAWLWALHEPLKLGAKARKLLKNTDTELWLSPISMWEVALLVERKRVRLKQQFSAWADESLRRWPVQEAVLTNAVALAAREVTLAHEDPADRFIAATAVVYELTLFTADERLLQGRGYRHLSCEL